MAKVAFDNRMIGSATPSFSRDYATVSDQGVACPPDTPRYGRAVGHCDPVELTEALDFDFGPNARIIGAAFAGDGQPMALVFSPSQQQFHVVKGDPPALVRSLPTNFSSGANQYSVEHAVIHDGAIVVTCERLEDTGGGFVVVGTSMMFSTDEMATYSMLDIPANTAAAGADEGMSRGNRFGVSGPTRLPGRPLSTDALLTFGDYLIKEGLPKGGQVFLLYLQRATPEDTWALTGRSVYDRWESGDGGGYHCHGAGIVSTSATDLVLVSSWGDVAYRNSLEGHSLTFDESWLTNPVTTRTLHGGFSTSATTYRHSPQPAHLNPGGRPGLVVASGDTNDGLVYGLGPLDDINGLLPVKTLRARYTRVESGGGYAGVDPLNMHYVPGLGYLNGGGNVRHLSLSEDGELWADYTGPWNNLMHLYGSKILGVNGSNRLVTGARPKVQRYHPIQLSRGSTNECSHGADCVIQGGGSGTVETGAYREIVYYDSGDGLFKRTSDDVPLDRQPDSLPPVDMSEDVLFMRVGTTASRIAGAVRFSTNSEPVTGNACLDVWACLISENPVSAEAFARYRGNGGGSSLGVQQAIKIDGHQQWTPIPNGVEGVASGSGYAQLRVADSSNNSYDVEMLLAFRGCNTGGMQPAYPTLPRETGPDELLSVPASGAMSSCSGRIVWVIPPNAAIIQETLEYAVLRGDADNYVVFRHEMPGLTASDMVVEVFVGGVSVGSATISGDAFVNDTIDLAYSIDGTTLTVTGRVGNADFATASATLSAAPTMALSELAFQSPAGGVASQEVLAVVLEDSPTDVSTSSGLASMPLRDPVVSSPFVSPVGV